MTAITGGEAAYQALVKLGVEHVFCIPSVHNLPILDAIDQHDGITPIVVRHEQAATHSADGYARASGRLGVVIASTGPGTTNTVTGIYEAGRASSRVLVITGQAESYYYGKGRGAGHEAENQLPMLRTVARRVESPKYTHDIAPAIFRTAADILTGRPQPGAVELPIDIQYGTTEVPVGEPHPVHDVPIDSTALDTAVDALSSASRRVIVAGGGVNHAGAAEELVALAEALDAPVFTTENGRGSIPDDHPLAMGPYLYSKPAREAIADAEAVLAVGTWFRVRATDPLPGTLIHMDVDPQSIGLNYKADIELIGDAKPGLKALLEKMNPEPGDSSFRDRVSSTSNEIKAGIRERIGPDMEAIMDTMREQMPRECLFVRDMTQPAYNWGNPLFPILAPRTTMNPTTGAIGPGLPLANGAALGAGVKTVVIHGDGGFMVHIGELATAVQYNLPLVICVFTDGGYGVLRGIQSRTFDGRTTGVNLATPNFVTVAEGMGMRAERVEGVDEFQTAFARAMADEGPVLLDINMAKLTPMQGSIIEAFTQPA
jgi:acetolactate synthase-1/2/3 large subunit